jgi:hypothetical protein
VPSSPLVVSSSLTDSSIEQLVRCSHRLCQPSDCYSPSTFTTTALSELAPYHDAILHPEWQHAMAEEIVALERTGTWDLVPCPPRHLTPSDGEPLEDPTRYCHIVGSLVYLGVTRPNISYFIHILSQFVSAPTQIHYSHLLRVLRYLCGTSTHRLFFPHSSSLQLQAYCDATWASDPSDHHSLSSYCVFISGSLIAWKTKKQVAFSHCSAEPEL